MRWLDVMTGQETPLLSAAWLPFAGFWLLLFILAAAELARPLRRSNAVEGRRLVTNFGLGLGNALILSALPFSTVLAAEWARLQGFGLLNWLNAPTAAVIAATLIARSFTAYALHWLAHRSPLLWRIHKVHHVDTAVDLSTGLRHHPLELLYIVACVGALAVALGLSPTALAIYEATAAAFSLWTHANLKLPEPLEPWLRRLLVTPAVHHLHHSSRQVETDSNYGDILTLWDRLLGTYCTPDGTRLERMRAGLGGAHDRGAANLLVQLGTPFHRGPVGPADPRRLHIALKERVD